jgi:hypothetical protein
VLLNQGATGKAPEFCALPTARHKAPEPVVKREFRLLSRNINPTNRTSLPKVHNEQRIIFRNVPFWQGKNFAVDDFVRNEPVPRVRMAD